jgi:hypothetical protein
LPLVNTKIKLTLTIINVFKTIGVFLRAESIKKGPVASEQIDQDFILKQSILSSLLALRENLDEKCCKFKLFFQQ